MKIKNLLKQSCKGAFFAIVAGLVMPYSAWSSVDYSGTDYEPWSYSAGCIVWRATSGQLFHESKVADVAADGKIGSTYTLNTSGHPWQVFASNQSQYSSPGKVLVYDESGYNNDSDAQFAPLSFGGMWVKVLQADNTPYCITDNRTAANYNRQVELGATGASTYFKFDESFTFNRNTATAVKGTATVEIAGGKTFTINARANRGAVVDSGNTLVLKGAGTLAVVDGLTVSGTLDLSAATHPIIDGNVSLAAGTIVLPEGTEVSPGSPFTVCTGTLSGANVYVKIGDAEAVKKNFTTDNGAITSFDDPRDVFTDNFPTTVPAGETYTFIGGETAENTVVVDALDVMGTLKTQGYFSFTNYKSNNGSTLDVESGSLTLNPGNNWFNGTLTVEAGATFVNTETDAVQYGGAFTANIYGTLDMGSTRWSLGSNNTINLYEGCTVTGSGQSYYGTFDWIDNATATLNVYGAVNLGAPIRIRSTATVKINVDADANAGLTLSGSYTTGGGTIVKKGAGLINFTSNPPYAITVENGAFTFAVDATPTITYSEKPGSGTSMSMWYATQPTWKGTVVIGVLDAPRALQLNDYGNANSKIVLKGTTGNCYLNGTTTVPAEVVIDTDEDHVVEFNNGNSGQIGTFSKISGAGTLKLTAWSNSSGVTYNINTFDGFTGTLAINNTITRAAGGTMTIGIGNIVTTGATTPGSRVLKLSQTAVSGATGTVVYDTDNAQVNGEPAKLAITAGGVYIAAASAFIGGEETYYTMVAYAYNAVSENGAPGDSFTVLDDNEYGNIDGFYYDSETKTYTKSSNVVAQFTIGVITYSYTTLEAACTAAEVYDHVPMIVLLVDIADVEIPEGWEIFSNSNGDDGSGTVLMKSGSIATTCVLRISEIMPKPTDSQAEDGTEKMDVNGLESGWVEVENTSSGQYADLADYRFIRVNRGKATKTDGYGNFPSRLVPPGGRVIFYTSERYPNSADMSVSAWATPDPDGKVPKIYTDYNDVLVWPDKVNPKKSPYVRLYYAPGGDSDTGTVVDTVVVPSDLPEGWSIIVGDAEEGEGTRRWMCPTPTRGKANTATEGLVRIGPNVGPLYEKKGQKKTDLASEFAAPVPPAVPGTDYTVTLPINAVMNPDGTFTPRTVDQIQAIKFVYRKDLDDTTLVTNDIDMAAKTTDANWGDQYTATIPSDYFPAAGHLMQWKVLITDSEGVEWTSPSFNNKDDGYEWYGTIVEPGDLNSATLPTWHMFASGNHLTQMDVDKDYQDLNLVPNYARIAIYDSSTSNYYDYVRIDLRGNTSAGFTKKGHGLRFAKAHPLTMKDVVTGDEIEEIRKTSLISEFADPSYMRQMIAFWLWRKMGNLVPFDFPVRCNLNGEFYQLAFNSERFTDELIEDVYGLDKFGYGYKNVGTLNSSGTTAGKIEKKTPDDEDETNISFLRDNLITPLRNNGANASHADSENGDLTKLVVEKFDLPAWINYLASARITQEMDDVWANVCAYCDDPEMKEGKRGTGTWMPLGYDFNLTFGQYYINDLSGNPLSGLSSTNDWYKSHPLYGGWTVLAHNSDGGSSMNGNNGFEAVYQSAKFRRLYLRRLRTLMDQELKEPGTVEDDTPFMAKMREMADLMCADAEQDQDKWPDNGTDNNIDVWKNGTRPAGMDEAIDEIWDDYVVPRREHLYVTHSVTNTAKAIGYGSNLNAGIPEAQSSIATLAPNIYVSNLTALDAEQSDALGVDGQFYGTEVIVITNGNDEVVDMSGWRLAFSVDFTFPAGTVCDANDSIYIVADRRAYIEAHDTELTDQVIVGNATFTGAGPIALYAADGTEVFSAIPKTPELNYLRLHSFCGLPIGDDNVGEWFVLTNISETATLDLTGVTVCFLKQGDEETEEHCHITFEGGSLEPLKSLRFNQDDWKKKGWFKIQNNKLDINITDKYGTSCQSLQVTQKTFKPDSDISWWLVCDSTDQTVPDGTDYWHLESVMRAINVNFTYGTGTGLDATSYPDLLVGAEGYAAQCSGWNNVAVEDYDYSSVIEPVRSSVKVCSDGVGTLEDEPSIGVEISGTRGSWRCSSLDSSTNLLHGYIDDSDYYTTPTVTLTDIPFDNCRVIVYASTDSRNVPFGHFSINGMKLTAHDGVTTYGTNSWGDSGSYSSAEALAEGVNYLVSPVVPIPEDRTLVITANRLSDNSYDGRGAIAAIQVIETDESPITHEVEFNLGAHGTYIGGELRQIVLEGAAPEAPELQVESGWLFCGWDTDFSIVTSNLVVTALYTDKYSDSKDASDNMLLPLFVVDADFLGKDSGAVDVGGGCTINLNGSEIADDGSYVTIGDTGIEITFGNIMSNLTIVAECEGLLPPESGKRTIFATYVGDNYYNRVGVNLKADAQTVGMWQGGDFTSSEEKLGEVPLDGSRMYLVMHYDCKAANGLGGFITKGTSLYGIVDGDVARLYECKVLKAASDNVYSVMVGGAFTNAFSACTGMQVYSLAVFRGDLAGGTLDLGVDGCVHIPGYDESANDHFVTYDNNGSIASNSLGFAEVAWDNETSPFEPFDDSLNIKLRVNADVVMTFTNEVSMGTLALTGSGNLVLRMEGDGAFYPDAIYTTNYGGTLRFVVGNGAKLSYYLGESSSSDVLPTDGDYLPFLYYDMEVAEGGTLGLTYTTEGYSNIGSLDLSRITGYGTVSLDTEYDRSQERNWILLPAAKFADTLSFNNKSDVVLDEAFSTNNPFATRNLSGNGRFRCDWGSDNEMAVMRELRTVQTTNTTFTGRFMSNSKGNGKRECNLNVASDGNVSDYENKRLTLSGEEEFEQTSQYGSWTFNDAKGTLTVEPTGALEINYMWGGPAEIYGAVGGTGGFASNLVFHTGCEFICSTNTTLTASGSITFEDSIVVRIDTEPDTIKVLAITNAVSAPDLSNTEVAVYVNGELSDEYHLFALIDRVYLTHSDALAQVTFMPGEHGTLSGDVGLEQIIEEGGDAAAPNVTADFGWRFAGWSHSIANMARGVWEITALYEPLYSLSSVEAMDGVGYSASFGSGEGVEWSAGSDMPDWLSITSDGTLSGTPDGENLVGTWTFYVIASDGDNTATLPYTITVAENPNHRPVVNAVTPTDARILARPGEQITVVVDGSDQDGNTLSYIWFLEGHQDYFYTDEPEFSFSLGQDDTSVHSLLCAVTDGFWTIPLQGNWTVRNGYYVVFDLGEHGICVGGGETNQFVEATMGADAPQVEPNDERFYFDRWDVDFSSVISNMTVNAVYGRVNRPIIDEPVEVSGSSDALVNTDYYFKWSVRDLNEELTGDWTITWYDSDGNGLTTNTVEGTWTTRWTAPGTKTVTMRVTDPANVVTERTWKYFIDPDSCRFVTFDLGDHGERMGGGALNQYLNPGEDAEAPVVKPNAGWIFTGWDCSFTNVQENVEVTAQYKVFQPDLVVEGVTVNNTAQGGDVHVVSWDVPNNGNASFNGRMTEYVRFISEDGTVTNTMAQLEFEGTISYEGSVSRSVEIALPLKGLEGNWFVEVETGANPSVLELAGNNITRMYETLTITPCPLPDITVADVAVLDDGESVSAINPGDLLTVTYSERNVGNADITGSWIDRIYVVDEADNRYTLDTFEHTQEQLDAEEVQREVFIPELIPLVGNVRFVVDADFDDRIVEQNDGNNTAESAMVELGRRMYLTAAEDSVYENNSRGVRFTVKRSGPVSSAMDVTLTVYDLTIANTPESVTIPAGSSSTTFYVTPIYDNTVTGPRTVQVTASVDELELEVSRSLVVLDNEVPHLYITLDSDIIRENGGVITATITRELVMNEPLTVNLSGASTSRCSYPSLVEIPAGAASVTFGISVPDNATAQIAQEYTIRASSFGYTPAAVSYTVEDDDVPGVTLSLTPEVVSEGAGAQAIYATLTRSDTNQITQAVRVRLTASAKDQLILPNEITIPKYTMAVRFAIGVIDNALDDGDREVTINGAILIESCGCDGQPSNGDVIQATVGIIDNDGPSLALKAEPTTMKEGFNPAGWLVLSHNSTLMDDLVVNLWTDENGEREVSITNSITIGAGETFVRIPVETLDDGEEDGAKLVTVYADAGDESGFAPASTWLQVSDQNLPDLQIAGISVPSSVVAFDEFEVSFTVTNTGFNACSRPVPYSVYLVRGARATSYSSYLSVKTGTLAGGIAVDGSLSGTVVFTAPELPGDCRVAVVVDPNGTIGEIDDANNTTWSSPVAVSVAYNAIAAVDGAKVYMPGETVSITGCAFYANGEPAANAEVEVYVLRDGTRRFIRAQTNDSGEYETTFTPFKTEAGCFAIGASYPSVGSLVEQDSFDVMGMTYVGSDYLTWYMTIGDDRTLTATIKNLSRVSLNNVSVKIVNQPEGCDIDCGLSGNTLPGLGALTLTVHLRATGVSAVQQYAYFAFKLECDEGVSAEVPAAFYAKSTEPYLSVTPRSVDATVAIGSVRQLEFTISNIGRADAGKISLSAPQLPWLHIIGDNIPSLEAGESATVTVELSPTRDDVTLGYTSSGAIGVNCANASPTSFWISMTPVSEETGSCSVAVADEFTYYLEDAPYLADASVSLQEYYSGKTVASGKTDETGTITFSNVHEGTYRIFVSAEKHGSYDSVITIEPGRNTGITAFLQCNVCTASWEVKPVEIDDSYEITLLLEYETQVPAPIVKGTALDVIPDLNQGDSFAFNIVLENIGLIRADNVHIVFPSIDGCTFYLPENNFTIEAKSAVTVPVVVTCDLKPGQSGPPGGTGGSGVGGGGSGAGGSTGTGGSGTGGGGGTGGNPDTGTPGDDPVFLADAYNRYCAYTEDVIYDYFCGLDRKMHAIPIAYRLKRDCTPSTYTMASSSSGSGDYYWNPTGYSAPTIGNGNSTGGSNDGTWTNPIRPTPTVFQKTDCVPDMIKKLNVLKARSNQELVRDFVNLSSEKLKDKIQGILDKFFGNDDDENEEEEEWCVVKAATDISDTFSTIVQNRFNIREALSTGGLELSAVVSETVNTLSDSISCIKETYKAILDEDLSVFGEEILEEISNAKELVTFVGEYYTDVVVPYILREQEISLLETYINTPSAYPHYDVYVATEAMKSMKASTEMLGTGADFTLEAADFKHVLERLLNGEFAADDSMFLIDVDEAVEEWEATAEGDAEELQERKEAVRKAYTRWNNGVRAFLEGETVSEDGLDFYEFAANLARVKAAFAYVNARSYATLNEMVIDAFTKFKVEYDNSSDSVCAKVSFSLSQNVTMVREGFKGTLTLFNGHDTKPMEDIELRVYVLDEQGDVSTELFGVSDDGMQGISGESVLFGKKGSLAAKEKGTADVLFVPTVNAAPTEPKVYHFGATLSYTDPFSGEKAVIELTPVALTVNPCPYLHFDYFIQRDVYADDPFTSDVVEASLPAELAVLIRNTGYGDAKKVTIASMKPEKCLDAKGVATDLDMKDYVPKDEMAINGATAHLKLSNLNLGTIEAHQSAVAQWWMTSTLEGHFIGASASVTHANSWGNPDTSLIDPDVGTHMLVKSMVADSDELPDFLVCDGYDLYGTPNQIYTARGEVEPVYLSTITAGQLGHGGKVTLAITATPAQSGWNYGYAVLPGIFNYKVSRIVRSDDGAELPESNAWITDRVFRDGAAPLLEERLHIVDEFDSDTAQTYTIYLEAKPSDIPEVTGFEGVSGRMEYAVLDSVTVAFSKPIDPDTFDADDIVLQKQGVSIDNEFLRSALTITPADESGMRFTISGLSAFCGEDEYGRYELTVQSAGVYDLFGHLGAQFGKSFSWVYTTAESPYILNADGIPVRRVKELDEITVTLSAPVVTNSFTREAVSIKRPDGGAAAVGSTVKVRALDVSGTRFAISGLAGEQTADGSYSLSIDTTKLLAIDGETTGIEEFTSEKWTRDTIAPRLVDMSRSEEFGGVQFIVEFDEDVEINTIRETAFTLDHESLPPTRGKRLLGASSIALPSNLGLVSLGDGRYALTGIDSLFSEDGEYTLTFNPAGTQDEAGNENDEAEGRSVTWTRDTTPPALIPDLAISPDGGFLDTDGVTYTRELTVAGTLPEEGLTVEIIAKYGNGETVLETFASVDADEFSREIALPADGPAVLIVRLTDAAGNSSDTLKSVFVDWDAITGEVTRHAGEYDIVANDNGVEEVITESATLAFSHRVMDEDVTEDKFSLTRDGVAVALEGVTFTKVDDVTFTLSGLGTLCDEDGLYVLTFNGTNVRKYTSGLKMGGSVVARWRYECPDREPPVVTKVLFDDEDPHAAYTNGCMFSSISVAFSEPVNIPELICGGLIGRAVRIDLMDAAYSVTGCVVVVDYGWNSESNTLTCEIDDDSVPAGEARLVLDAGLICDLAGNHLAVGEMDDAVKYMTFTLSEEELARVNAYAMPCWYNGELYVGEKTEDDKGKIRHYEANGTWSYLQSNGEDIEVVAQGCQGASVAFADMDGDGNVEIYVGTADGRVLKYQDGAYQNGVEFYKFDTPRAVPCAYDLEGDGRDELFVGGMNGRIRIFTQPDEVSISSWNFADSEECLAVPNGRAAPVVADVNHDGFADVFSGDTAGNIWVYLGEGDNWCTQPICVFTNNVGLADRSRLGYGDVDGDGIDDLIVGRSDGSVTVMYGAEASSPSLSFSVKAVITATAGEHGAIAPEGDATYDGGNTPTYTITPDTGYQVEDVTVDGDSLGSLSNYAFDPLTASHTISATFATIPYAITYTGLKEGATNTNPETYTIEDSITFVEPGYVYGWVFKGWAPEGIALGSTGPVDVSAEWERQKFDVTVNGETTQYSYEDVVTFPVPVDPVFESEGIQVLAVGTTYNDIGVTNEVAVKVMGDISFDWDILATNWWFEVAETQNGSITAPDAGWLPDGTNFVMSVEPAENHHFVCWYGDTNGCEVVEGGLSVTMDQPRAIGAAFAIDTFAVTFGAGAHGALSGATAQTIDYGSAAAVPGVAPDAGYEFTGWSGDVTAHVVSNATFTAQYAAIPYAITYTGLKGATNGNPTTYTVEDAITFAAPGDVYGWVFKGWAPEGIALGSTGPVDVSAEWERQKFDVTVNGETTQYSYEDVVTFPAPVDPVSESEGIQVLAVGTTYNDIGVTNEVSVKVMGDISFDWNILATNWWFEVAETQNGSIIAPDSGWMADGTNFVMAVKPAENHHFVCWYGDTNGCEVVEGGLSVTMDQPRAIGAAFAIDTFAVTFDAGEHGTLEGELSQTIDYGSAAVAPTVTPDAGYTFTGWSCGFSEVTGDLTVTAQYETISYDITYTDLMGAENGNPTTYTVEDAITFAAPGDVYGWVFKGWTPASIALGSIGDVEVLANWERQKFDVTVNGETRQYSYEDELTFTAPEPLDADGMQVVALGTTYIDPVVTNEFTVTVTNDIEFTWDILATNWWFEVSETQNGSVAAPEEDWMADGTNFTLTATADEHYHFVGWTGDTNGCEVVDGGLSVTMDQARTIGAEFAIDTFMVAFDAGEHGTLEGELSQTIDYGSAAVEPAVTAEAGYSFTGWSCGFSEVTGNLTVTAQYAAIPYAITYTGLKDATNGNPTTYTVEDAITFENPGEVYGWVFKGWSPASIALGSIGDVEVLANWERQKFDVTVNGETTQYDYEYVVMLVTNEVINAGTMQYVCKGWTATNADPSYGNGAQAVFTVLDNVEFEWLWQTNEVSLAESVAADEDVAGLNWTTGGAVEWVPEWSFEASDGNHMAVARGVGSATNAWISCKVTGPGEVSFMWSSAISSRNTKYQVMVDGDVKSVLTGTNGWTPASVSITGDGEQEHEIKWRIITGRSGVSVDDWVALDAVMWSPVQLPPGDYTPTLQEALNTNLNWIVEKDNATTGWTAVARRDLGEIRDAWVEVTEVNNDSTNTISTTVYGSGTLTFDWAISCEEEYDWMELTIDGEFYDYITGEVDWESCEVEIYDDGKHIVCWSFIKDEMDEDGLAGDNTAKLDNVVWLGGQPTETQETPVPVPFAVLESDSEDDNFKKFLDMAKGDYEAAAKMEGSNGYKVWESYVAGLNPADENSKFISKIEMVDGVPVVTWEPDLGETRIYTTYGKKSLGDEKWEKVDEDKMGEYNFFKVGIDLK